MEAFHKRVGGLCRDLWRQLPIPICMFFMRLEMIANIRADLNDVLHSLPGSELAY